MTRSECIKILLLCHLSFVLPGGGLREKVFWRNYFFHCAYTRYEAGLSIDEIWSENALEERTKTNPLQSVQQTQHQVVPDTFPADTNNDNKNNLEETITFEPVSVNDEDTESENVTALAAGGTPLFNEATNDPNVADISDSAAASDYEMVASSTLKENSRHGVDVEEDVVENLGLGGDEDYELDELEAEIARELEDD